MQDRVSSRRDLVKAMRAGIDPALGKLVELAFYAASGAVHERSAKAHGHDMLKAGLLIGEALEELANREFGAAGR